MRQFFTFCGNRTFSWRRICKLLLALCWHLGLLAGVLAAAQMDPELLSLMRRALSSPVSIVGLLAVLLIPFLFSAFAVLMNTPWIVLGICFAKAYSFGFVSMAVCQAFGNAGWLIRWMLLFSSVMTAPVLFWFWLRQISGNNGSLWIDFLLCAVLVLFLGILDYRFVAPFLQELVF